MNYEKAYKDALERAKKLYEQGTITESLSYVFPELKESEDERIRKVLIDLVKCNERSGYTLLNNVTTDSMLAWLEKQGDTNETINRDEFTQGVLRGAAINLITWIDYNAAEGNTCLSNMECKDIEDALVSGDWNKIYTYIKKKLEKQSKQKHIFDFKAADWHVSKVDGKIHNIYNSRVEPKFSEKKELKKIVPIFNIGDTIAKKHNSDINKFGQFTITDITGGKYWYNSRIICDITEQDEWELVE